jgi:hypothetical protein
MRSQTAIEIDVARLLRDMDVRTWHLGAELGFPCEDASETCYRLARAYVMDCESHIPRAFGGESPARPTYEGFLRNLARYK